MLPSTTNPNANFTPTMSSPYISNSMILQNMQDYLKFLLFNVNIAEYAQSTKSQTTENLSPPSEKKTPSIKRERKLKTSGRLWNLMVKKYSTKKVKPAEEHIDPKETTEEGEIYRKYHGVYIPVLKSNAPM